MVALHVLPMCNVIARPCNLHEKRNSLYISLGQPYVDQYLHEKRNSSYISPGQPCKTVCRSIATLQTLFYILATVSTTDWQNNDILD